MLVLSVIKVLLMYIPKTNLVTDTNEIVDFMKQFSFATVITAKDNFPTATHLPFIISNRDDKIVLTSHFAKANTQWEDIERDNILTIFSEPHAYISPANYDSRLNVPTWNYVSVHAYGQGKIISETEEVFKVLEATINTYEQAYKLQWDELPEEYKLKLLNGIVAFEITVSDLQAKKKLSQNRSQNEQVKIINSLAMSPDANAREIARLMKEEQ